MLKSLELMNNVRKMKDIPENEIWLKYIMFTAQKNVNLRNVSDIKYISTRFTFEYVKRTLEVLENEIESDKASKYSLKEISIVEDVLKWSEVAKCGSVAKRTRWAKKGYDLNIHNEASAEIYKDDSEIVDYVTYILIKTHGMIGQYVHGEVNLEKNKEITNLITERRIEKESLYRILVLLNHCIIEAVRPGLYCKVKEDVNKTIKRVVDNKYERVDFENPQYILERFKMLFPNKADNEFKEAEIIINNKDVCKRIGFLFENFELWYPNTAFSYYSLIEIIKVFLICLNKVSNEKRHINFRPMTSEVYYMYKGMKVQNLFKQRIIESYLDSLSLEDITNNCMKDNEHIEIDVSLTYTTNLVGIRFSEQAKKLIEFCEVAYGTSDIYNQSVFMLYDLFGFRRDNFDRFYNEISYLSTMNSTINFKAVLLDYIEGNSCLDVGPGGGALLDLIESSKKVDRIVGVDISQNVIEELNKRKYKENKKWEVIKGDALELKQLFKKGEIDTIIFSSVIHELFSYIEMDGKKFNYKTIEKVIKSCYDILPIGGRIIIRDGIMSETNNKRIIVFKDENGLRFLNKYCKDFKGREITYRKIDDRTVEMFENDAMEFLYTYTWGEESYPMEVQEQFGYYSPSSYLDMFSRIGNFKVIECKHFLQEGYEEHLLKKIEFYDENRVKIPLPDSTCVIVIEKV